MLRATMRLIVFAIFGAFASALATAGTIAMDVADFSGSPMFRFLSFMVAGAGVALFAGATLAAFVAFSALFARDFPEFK